MRDLQSVPLDRMMSAYFEVVRRMNVDQMTQGFSPLVDGTVVPQHPFHPDRVDGVGRRAGDARLDAHRADVERPGGGLLADRCRDARRASGSCSASHADEAIQVYQKANPGATPSDIYFLIASDYRYSGPVMKIAERRAALGKGPVYLYYFRWETPVDGGRLKSPHTIEIPFAFDNVQAATRLTGGGPEAMALADKVSDTWIAFAKTGNPNQPKMPRWPAFNAEGAADDGVQHREPGGERSDQGAAARDVESSRLRFVGGRWWLVASSRFPSSYRAPTTEPPATHDIPSHARRVHSARRRAVAVRGDGLSARRRRSTRGLSPLGAIGSAAPPRALLVVSAHWEEPVPTVMTAERPPILYDYYGFPPESYTITWPAPGAPELASRVRELLDAAGIANAADAERGYDHGTFIPLKLTYPDADVPAIQLSLKQRTRSRRAPRARPRAHAAPGRGRVHHRQRDDVPQPARVSRSPRGAGGRDVRCLAARDDDARRRIHGTSD